MTALATQPKSDCHQHPGPPRTGRGSDASDRWPGRPTGVFGLAGLVWNCFLIGWQHLRIERFHLKTHRPHFSKQRWMTWPPRATPGHPRPPHHPATWQGGLRSPSLCSVFPTDPLTGPSAVSRTRGAGIGSGHPLAHGERGEGPGDPGKARTHSRLGLGPPVSAAGMGKQTPRVGGHVLAPCCSCNDFP